MNRSGIIAGRNAQRRSFRIGAAVREFDKINRRVRVTAARSKIRLPGHLGRSRSRFRLTAPTETRTPNWHRANMLNYECGWKSGDRSAVACRP